LIEYENGLGTMFQDETKVSQCLTNFLSNAFKFTSEGTVTLTIEPFDENGVEMIRFNVQDTGVGMTPEQLVTVFEEYQQGERSTKAETAQRGTGLGLSLTKSYAELMGGRVDAESEKGVGSTFAFIIPRDFSNDEASDANDPIVRNLDDQSIVVLIDDDPAMHDVVRRTLSKSGVTMVGATNGERGLEIVRESKPKLILLDVYMSGRDGWSILREVKSDPELKDIPVVMVTQLSEERFAKSLGADGYFTKPIDRKRFVEEISRILGAASPSEQVLVIDDDENTRTLLSRILAEEGWQSIVANDGIDGLEKINELGEKDQKPSLIVLDIDMPRMDGFEFLEVYSRDIPAERRSPVLIFSGKDLSTMQHDLLVQYENVRGVQSKEDVPGLTALIKEIQQETGASVE
jgi:CheY-like chemotaxis protein